MKEILKIINDNIFIILCLISFIIVFLIFIIKGLQQLIKLLKKFYLIIFKK